MEKTIAPHAHPPPPHTPIHTYILILRSTFLVCFCFCLFCFLFDCLSFFFCLCCPRLNYRLLYTKSYRYIRYLFIEPLVLQMRCSVIFRNGENPSLFSVHFRFKHARNMTDITIGKCTF